MARRKKRRSQFRDASEVHRDKANHAFSDSAHHAALAKRAAEKGSCASALKELLIANGAYEEAKAHVESGGRSGASRWSAAARRGGSGGGGGGGGARLCLGGRSGASRWSAAARRAVSGAEREVGSSCFCLRD